MEHGQQEVQPGISLGRNWSTFPEDLSQRDRLQRPYGNHQRLESHQTVVTGALVEIQQWPGTQQSGNSLGRLQKNKE
ncbi:hypothetical protein O181_113395 [Austropuccinia psidii MF-1]|uniref:Uncharacterized protein n=1 Tax=Austropuccinia psidii MF-1 TaxID=1389203 RepID=A0A9Q3PUH1_9BASI|nr:hypothetical protein [Austropuccinia psidii MF-1]